MGDAPIVADDVDVLRVLLPARVSARWRGRRRRRRGGNAQQRQQIIISWFASLRGRSIAQCANLCPWFFCLPSTLLAAARSAAATFSVPDCAIAGPLVLIAYGDTASRSRAKPRPVRREHAAGIGGEDRRGKSGGRLHQSAICRITASPPITRCTAPRHRSGATGKCGSIRRSAIMNCRPACEIRLSRSLVERISSTARPALVLGGLGQQSARHCAGQRYLAAAGQRAATLAAKPD